MVFMCNKCFIILTGQPNEVSFLTSCLHILCNKCSQEMQNNICAICNKPCKIVKVTKDMPAAVKSYFEPPLMKVQQLQHQLRFLKYQQQLAFTMKKQVIKNKRESDVRMQRLVEYEQAAIADKIRLEALAKAKVEEYNHLKEQYKKMIAEEQRIRQRIEAKQQQQQNLKDLSADSGVHSSDRTRSFDH